MFALLTATQAAVRLGYDVSHVRRLLKRGALRGTRLGWGWLIETREVERYAQAYPHSRRGRPRKAS